VVTRSGRSCDPRSQGVLAETLEGLRPRGSFTTGYAVWGYIGRTTAATVKINSSRTLPTVSRHWNGARPQEGYCPAYQGIRPERLRSVADFCARQMRRQVAVIW